MSHQLLFETILRYDQGQSGIGLPLILRANQKFVDVDAKLDTGASDCIFEREHGEVLGLDLEHGQLRSFGTATGSFDAYGHLVTLCAADFEFEVMVWFAKDIRFNRNVIGRTGFIDRVLIGLNDYAGRLYLSRNVDDADEQ